MRNVIMLKIHERVVKHILTVLFIISSAKLQKEHAS